FVGEQLQQSILVHDHHHQVHFLSADLEADASTFDVVEGRSAPSSGDAAGGDALAVSTADAKAAFFQCRDNGDAVGLFEDVTGNAFIGGGHDLIQHLACFLQAVDVVGTALRLVLCKSGKR